MISLMWRSSTLDTIGAVSPTVSRAVRYVGPLWPSKTMKGQLTDIQEFNFLLCVADSDFTWPASDTVTEKVTHEAMMADYSDRGVDNRFLQLLIKADPVRWGFFHHRHTSTYHRDRTVLIGDSAHASLPFQAAGAAQALEDALILSILLSEIATTSERTTSLRPHIHAALEAYDAVRRPRAQKQVEQSAEVALMIHFQHSEAGSDMSRILPKLQHGRFDWLWFHDLRADIQSASRNMSKNLEPTTS